MVWGLVLEEVGGALSKESLLRLCSQARQWGPPGITIKSLMP